MELKVLSLFSGIGAFEKALENLDIDYKLVNYCEIDESASKSYSAVHGVSEDLNLWDITKIDANSLPKDIDLITHGSPCTDFSLAGKQAGGDKGSGTRSSLMWNTLDIVSVTKPKYVIWENVRNLTSAKHIHNFDGYLEVMHKLGYNSYYRILNAKDYGIPQNRERVYTISIRKDVDDHTFKFPEPQFLKLRLRDMLEENVDEKYYLNDAKVSRMANWNAFRNPLERVLGNNSIAGTLTARDGGSDHSGMSVYSDRLNNTTNLLDSIKQYIKEQPSLMVHNINQTVKVRKYPVNVEELQNTLISCKNDSGLSCKEISEKLNLPQTTVEHYFRTDNEFAIPDPEIWYNLKDVINITTDKFDESITAFEEKENTYDKSNRVYNENGIAPTLTSQIEKVLTNKADMQLLGNYMPSGHSAGRIFDTDGIAPTVMENHGTVTAIVEKKSNQKEDVSDYSIQKMVGNIVEGDVAKTITANAMSGFNRDNCQLIVEQTKNNIIKTINDNAKHQQDLVQSEDDICRTIPAGTHESTPHLLKTLVTDDEGIDEHSNPNTMSDTSNLRIRKLTPLECWRLMGFDDEDYYKAEKVCSNSQLYKQAGNSIVVNVLQEIYKNLFLKGEGR